MIYRFLFFFLAFNIGFIANVKCQDYETKANQYLKYATRAVDMKDYYTAIDMLEKYLLTNPNKTKVKLNLAEYYFVTRQFIQAEQLISELLSDKANDSDLIFLYARTQKSLGKYNLAIENFEKCRKLTKTKSLAIKCRKEVVGCNLALESINEPHDVKIANQSLINSNHLESSPVFADSDLMLYSSLKSENEITINIYDSSNIAYSKLYWATLNDSVWTPKGIVEQEINQIDYHITNGAFSDDKQRFYYTKCRKNWENKNICNLCVSSYLNNAFGASIVLNENINKKNYTSTQPTVANSYNHDLEIIYFASDRPDGLGGMDIWYIVYNKVRKTFTEPKNAGSKINTSYNEITPFFNNNTKTLYFSSDRPIGFGGYDIFKAKGELKSWHITQNVGFPINTNSDDIYYSINQKQDKGLLVSNRIGSKTLTQDFCCYDIYTVDLSNFGRVAIKGTYLTKIDPTIEKLLNNGLELIKPKKENKQVALYMYFDNYSDSIFVAIDSVSENGDFEIMAEKNNDYKLHFYHENEIEGSLTVSTNDVKDNEVNLEKTEINVLPKQSLIVNNITYEFGSSTLTQSAKTAIDSSLIHVMQQNTKIYVQISSHTDSVGNSSYNLKLSEQRAENVVAYMVSKGISENRLVPKGFGETKPLEPNTLPDGTDNVKGREKNRRTEFKIIKAKKPEETQRKQRSEF